MRTMVAVMAAAVVLMAGVMAFGEDGGKKKEKPVEVEIKGMKFDPPTVKVKAGETVVWTNEDDRDHTVVSDEQKDEKKGFKSGNIKRGETFEHRFTKAGKYPYSCSYHPRMKGVVVVTED